MEEPGDFPTINITCSDYCCLIKRPNIEPYDKNRFIISHTSMSQKLEQGSAGQFFYVWYPQRSFGATELVGRLLQGSFLHLSDPQQRRLESWAQLEPPDTSHVVSPAWRPHISGLCAWRLRVRRENVPRDPAEGCGAPYDLEVPEFGTEFYWSSKSLKSAHIQGIRLQPLNGRSSKNSQPYLLSHPTRELKNTW